MPDREKVEKLAKVLMEAVYSHVQGAWVRVVDDFWIAIGEKEQKRWCFVAKDVLARFVPRTEHERVVGELEEKYNKLLKRYAEMT